MREAVGELNKAATAATSSVELIGSKLELGYNYLNRDCGVAVGIFGNSQAGAM